MTVKSRRKRPLVVNVRTEGYDVYIGRGSIWGNPFRIGKDGSKDEVIEKYREMILERPDLLRRLPELEGKRLGCFCKPKACHGDVLVELIEGLVLSETEKESCPNGQQVEGVSEEGRCLAKNCTPRP